MSLFLWSMTKEAETQKSVSAKVTQITDSGCPRMVGFQATCFFLSSNILPTSNADTKKGGQKDFNIRLKIGVSTN